MKKLAAVIFVVVFLFAFTACDDSSSRMYTVTFDTAGAGDIESQSVKRGGRAVKPKDPVKEKAVFKEWEKDGVKYDFSTHVTKDITLKAVYSNLYTVVFDSDGGTYTPEKQLVIEGNTATEPKSPDKSGTKGFMWWTKDNECYDFSTPLSSDITLKAVYWPSATEDRETYDSDVVNLKNEVRCLHNIVRVLINPDLSKDLLSGATDVKTIFNITGSSNDTVRYLFANLRMHEDKLIIKGNSYNLEKVTTTIKFDDDSLTKIKKNNTTSETKNLETKYTIDIEGLSFKLDCCGSSEDNTDSRDCLSSTLYIQGTVIKHSSDRYEFHLQLIIENDGNITTYPIIHAGAIKAGDGGDDNILFYNYKGYSGYIPNVKLW